MEAALKYKYRNTLLYSERVFVILYTVKALSHRTKGAGYMKIGENIRNARRRQDLTQEQLAARMQLLGCEITRSALAKIEVGQRMLCPDELKALRSALSVSYDDILL